MDQSRPLEPYARVAARHERRRRRARGCGGRHASRSARAKSGIVNYDDYITPESRSVKDLNWASLPPPPPEQRGAGAGGGRGGGPAVDTSATMGAFRWNWSTPFILSESTRGRFISAPNHVFRARTAAHLARRSPDLTNDTERTFAQVGRTDAGRRSGSGTSHGTIVTVAESPHAGRAVGRHRLTETSDRAQRRRGVGRIGRTPPGLPSRPLHQPRRAAAPYAAFRYICSGGSHKGRSTSALVSSRPATARRGRHQRQPARDRARCVVRRKT